MKVGVLNAVVKIASKISNQSSTVSLFRSVELGRERLRCVSEYGNIIIATEDTGLTTPVLIDTEQISGTVRTLPQDAEMQLSQIEGRIAYTCGTASGAWNIVQSDDSIPEIDHTNFPWKPSEDLPNALMLASSACQMAAVAVGLYGIDIEPDCDNLRLLSANGTSLASVTIPKGTFPAEKLTLRPPVPSILASYLATCPNCEIDVTAEGIFVKGDWLTAHLPTSIPLEHNLKEMADIYPNANHTAKIDSGAVKRFITRARNLSDKHAFFTVVVKVDSGRLMLTHASIATKTEEWFLADGLDTALTFEPVPLAADMLLACLEHVQNVVFDYLGDKTLILKGTEPDFCYIIGGGDDN